MKPDYMNWVDLPRIIKNVYKNTVFARFRTTHIKKAKVIRKSVMQRKSVFVHLNKPTQRVLEIKSFCQ